jgi:hypothetical protein
MDQNGLSADVTWTRISLDCLEDQASLPRRRRCVACSMPIRRIAGVCLLGRQ